jgi:tight adherence protein B
MHRGLTVSFGAVVAGAVLFSPAAQAVELDSVQVSSIAGRTVHLTATLPDGATLVSSSDVGRPAVGAPGPLPTSQATVTIDGQVLPARLTAQSPSARPAVVLVVDASGSMAGAPIAQTRQAVDAYLSVLPAGVDVGLVAFGDTVGTLVPPGPEYSRIVAAMADLRPRGDTRLYDAILQATRILPAESTGRLVVLTDGGDTASSTTLDRAVEAARGRKAAIDVVLLDPDPSTRSAARRLAEAGSVTSVAQAAQLVEGFLDAARTWLSRLDITLDVPTSLDARGAEARVEVQAGGEQFTGSVQLPDIPSLEALPVTTGSVPLVPVVEPVPPGSTLARSWAAVVTAVAAAVTVLLGAWGWQSLRSRRARRGRVSQVLVYTSSPRTGAMRTAVSAAGRPWLGEQIRARAAGRRLALRLGAADISLSPSAWLGLEAAVLVAAAALLWLLTGRAWLGMLIGMVLTPLIFGSVLRTRVTRRQRAFSDELPDFLLLLSSALRAGLSFTESLQSAAEQHPGEVGRQIRRALGEAQVSANLDEALLACADRMENEDLRWAVTALSVQREVGGNLSVILDNAAATIKSRHAIAREVRTLSAEGRLSAYILIALPLGVLAFLAVFRYDYISQLWSSTLGIAMLLMLVLLLVVGWIWMRAVVRIRA